MSHTIWKYPLNPHSGESNIEMPMYSIPLSVQVINDEPVIYALVNLDEKEKEVRTFRCIWTGEESEVINPRSALMHYMGTFVMNSLVYHVFQTARAELPQQEEELTA